MALITYPRTKGKYSTSTSSLSAYKCGVAPNPKLVPVRLKHAIGLIQFDGWKYQSISWTKRSHQERQKLRKDFNSVKRKFLKDLAKNEEILMSSGFSQADIELMKTGRNPLLYEVHHKVPLDDGGTNDISNLVLIKSAPYHDAIHSRSQDYQKKINSLSPGDTVDVDFPVADLNCKIWPLNQSDPIKVILRVDNKAIKDRVYGLKRLTERGIKLNEELI